MTSSELLGMLSQRLAANLKEDPSGVRDESIQLARTYRTKEEFETANRSLLKARGVLSEYRYIELSREIVAVLPSDVQVSESPMLTVRELPRTQGFEIIKRKKVWLCAFCKPKPGEADPLELASSTKQRHE